MQDLDYEGSFFSIYNPLFSIKLQLYILGLLRWVVTFFVTLGRSE